MSTCLTSDREGYVIACPECDEAGCVRQRSGGAIMKSDSDHEYGCDQCGARFDEPNERERHPPAKGNAKYEHLTLEDVGLDPMET